MEKEAKRKVLISVFFIILISFPIPLIVFNMMNSNPDLYSIRIEGNVSEILTFKYEDLVDGVFGKIINQEFTFQNRPPHNDQYEVNYTGVSVWGILEYASVHYPNSTGIYFKSYDSYTTEILPLEKIETNPLGVIIAYQEGDDPLNPNDDGPMRAIVNLSVTLPDYCSKYWAKQVNTFVIV